MRYTQRLAAPHGRRWGCLRSLPLDGYGGEALVSLGAEQWLRLPISGLDAVHWQQKLGKRVGVDTALTPMQLVPDGS